jgi:hypothetical protein
VVDFLLARAKTSDQPLTFQQFMAPERSSARKERSVGRKSVEFGPDRRRADGAR